MTAAELHIRTNQRYQEVASNKRDTFFPEEIDLALNTAQDRFIIEKVDMFLQDNQTDLAAVSPLIIKNRALPTLLPTVNDIDYEPNMVYSVLPANLQFMLRARAEVVYNSDNCGGVPALETQSYNEFVSVVPIPASLSAPYYAAFALTGAITYDVIGTGYNAGFGSPKALFRLVSGAMSYFNTAIQRQFGFELELYWERYRGRYYKNSFILVTPNNQGAFGVSITGGSNSVLPSTTSYTIYNRSLIPSLPLTTKVVDTRSTENAMLYAVQSKNNFYKTRQRDVIVNQVKDYLFAYVDESFLVTRQYIDYIRKPREISLALNTSCELEVAIPEIIDLAVEILRLDTKDRNYPQTVQDTELRNKL